MISSSSTSPIPSCQDRDEPECDPDLDPDLDLVVVDLDPASPEDPTNGEHDLEEVTVTDLTRAMDDLELALTNGDKEARKRAAEYFVKNDINKECPETGLTALHLAVTRDSVPSIDFLSKWGSEVNKRGSGNISTPVMEAARHSRDKSLRRLLELGASINDNGLDSTHLHECCMTDDSESMSILVRFGAAVNLAEEATGKTALTEAVECQALACARILLDSGADYSTCDPLSGCDALHSAVMGDNEECIRLLIEYGADINSQNSMTKISALEEAAIAKSQVGVGVLLEAGVEPKFLNMPRDRIDSMGLPEKARAVLDWGDRVSSPVPEDEDICVGGLPPGEYQQQHQRYPRPQALFPNPLSLYGTPYQQWNPRSGTFWHQQTYGSNPYYNYSLNPYY